ncbi:MAG: replicative DNA helicase [Parvibaculales bacterium]
MDPQVTPLPTPQDEDAYRPLPHNIEAEQGLLGALLVNNDVMDKVEDFLLPRHFHDPVHGRIFEAAIKFIGNGNAVSPVTLKTYFEHDEGLQQLGGTAYLSKLASNATTIINARQYGQTIYDLAVRRELINLGEEMVNTAYDAEIDESPDQQIEQAEQGLYEIAEKGAHQSGFINFQDSVSGAVEMAERAYQREGHLSGLSSGFTGLDNVLGGLQESDLLILAGRPAMGKTSLATNIAFSVAKNHARAWSEGNVEELPDGSRKARDGAVVAFFSLEMSAEQLATRIIAEQTEISSGNIRKGDISEDEYGRLYDAARDLQSLPLYIDHTGAIPISTLSARARRLKRQHDLGLIVVDYLQLVRASASSSGDNRVQEISMVTQGLKALAKELNVPIIALSQLSRQVESRDDKRPQLSDLRESGSIEQDADIVMFVYREEYYVLKEEPQDGTEEHMIWQEKMEKVHGIAELIIGKNRHGPVDNIKLSFDAKVTRFRDLAESSYLPERIDV